MAHPSLVGIQTYKYGLYVNPEPDDAWNVAALKLFDEPLYNRTMEYTKTGATVYEAETIVREVCSKDRTFIPQFDKDEKNDWERVKRQAILDFSCDGFKVQPLTLEQALEGMTLDTSAGFGYPGKKKFEVIDDIFAETEELVRLVKMGRTPVPKPTLIGTRGHLHLKTSKKRRITYNAPSAYLLMGRMFSTPVTTKQKENQGKSPMFFGKNLIPRLKDLLEIDNGPGSVTLQSDLEHFDRDLLIWLMNEAFDVYEELIDFEHWNGAPIKPSTQKRWRRVFKYYRDIVIHTLIMLPSSELLWQDGSMASGFDCTQLMDTFCNYLMLKFIALRTGHGVYDLKALGDDGKLDMAGRPDLELWEKLFMRWFKMTLSVKKTKIFGRRFRQKQFLGYDLRSGFLERDSLELFCLAAHPEKAVTSITKSFTRMIAYMFLGGVNDHKFCKFFEFYQSCYDIPDEMPDFDYEMKTKQKYAGLEIPVKTLRAYTIHDFMWGLISYKNT
jgi:hypothetical protein